MKLTYLTKAEAQARADKLHADLIATNPLYAESAALYDPEHPEKGGTARWCFPQQTLDAEGKVVNPLWAVAVDEKVVATLSTAEIAKVPELVVGTADVVKVPVDVKVITK